MWVVLMPALRDLHQGAVEVQAVSDAAHTRKLCLYETQQLHGEVALIASHVKHRERIGLIEREPHAPEGAGQDTLEALRRGIVELVVVLEVPVAMSIIRLRLRLRT